ncbi:MAG: SMC-Scp complex subunit ScpB, partial [Clostridia bacterium]|nr:SMC-Scp complex subunit ScpB [Clostridia bacterium]
MDSLNLKFAVEAILFANGSAIAAQQIADCLEVEVSRIHELVSELMTDYEADRRGMKIVRLL